jgi:hypothetical protein
MAAMWLARLASFVRSGWDWLTRSRLRLAAAVLLLLLVFTASELLLRHPAGGPPSLRPRSLAVMPLPGSPSPLSAPVVVADDICSAPARHASLWRTLGNALVGPAHAEHLVTTNTARSSGDVHLETLNGYRFDFQAVGEFVAFEAKPSLLVQVRQQPYGDSRRVSVTTALAISADGDIVSVYGGAADPLYVNHVVTTLGADTLSLPHGAVLRRQGNGFAVRLQGSYEVRVTYGTTLDYQISLCSQAGPARGLLGPATLNPPAIVARTGKTVVLTGAFATDYPGLYRTFGDSWRITDESSLFDYAAGESTATFTDRAFPYADPLQGVSPSVLAWANQVCARAGISDPDALRRCVTDVAATGDAAFAASDAVSDALYDTARHVGRDEGNWRCDRASAGWDCRIANLAGARIGSSVRLRLETLGGKRVATETLTCGPVDASRAAVCAKGIVGAPFQDGVAVEDIVMISGETLRVTTHTQCFAGGRSKGEAC